MTSPPRHARRALAFAASACIGAAGALALATPASAHHSVVDGKAACDPATGEWVITWTVANSEADLTGDVTDVVVAPHAELATITVGATLPKQGEGVLQDEMRVGGDVTAASLTVTVHWDRDGRQITETDMATLDLGGGCAATAPTVESHSDCDSLAIVVSNPSTEPVQATITIGDTTTELAVPPGDTGEVTVDAGEGTVATVTIGEQSVEVPWRQPEDCDEPEDGEGGGDLPETGVPAGLVAGAAVALLALGGGLYVLARRRRITFTA